MGGEFNATIGYGFEVNEEYVRLRGYKNVYICCKIWLQTDLASMLCG